MRADVLQAVALCCHGNAFLALDSDDNPPEFVGHIHAFKGVEDVIFERKPLAFAKSGPIAVAGATGPWFRRLRHEGIERLELRLSQCTLDQAKSGPWGLVTDGDVGLELWQPTAKARMVNYGDPLVWKVRYTSERIQRWTLGPLTPFEKATELLVAAKDAALLLAQDLHKRDLEAILEKAATNLQGGPVEKPPYPDLFPASLPEENQRLMSAAMTSMLVISSSAWDREALARGGVIGRFDVVSQLVWKCAMTAFETAANSWQPKASELPRAA